MATIDIAGPSDFDAITTCLTRSLWDFPETVHLLPNERNRYRVLPRYLRSDAKDAASFHALFAAQDGAVVVGAAAWLPPGAYPINGRRQLAEAMQLLPVAPWGIGALVKGRRGQAANRSRHIGCPPHYWLRAIGVDPDRQREGIGTELIRPVLLRADQEQLGCFLFTATAANAAWYESLGFATMEKYNPTPTWPTSWAMWRAPQACENPK